VGKVEAAADRERQKHGICEDSGHVQKRDGNRSAAKSDRTRIYDRYAVSGRKSRIAPVNGASP
jgi:hypothetical protein